MTSRSTSAGISDLVLSLADCKQLLGLRYAEWCSATPTLEADIAAAAMGLDDLGHSRVLAGCLTELGPDPRGPERESEPGAYRNVAFLDDTWTEWEQFVAANAILDTAFTVMIESLVESEFEVLRTRLRKMLAEERYHFLHGRSWLNELGTSPAVEQAWQEAIEWFGPDGRELRRRLAEKLDRPEPDRLEIDWSRWDPVRRRTKPGAIDKRTFDMLRGLEERRYGISGAQAPARG
jgi:1,2-phenylacetyl-CoA epoxidase catalytic subunit